MSAIRNPAQDAILAGDSLHLQKMKEGSNSLLTAMNRTLEGKAPPARQRPALVWNDGSNGYTYAPRPGSHNSRRAGRAVLALLAEKERVRSLVVTRDPCPRCGTRGDVGCKHQRTA